MVSNDVKDAGTAEGREDKSQEQLPPLHVSRTASWEGWGRFTEAPGAARSSQMPFLPPPQGMEELEVEFLLEER